MLFSAVSISGVFVVVDVVKRKLLRKQFNSSSVSFLGWGQSNQPRDIFASLSEAKAFVPDITPES